MENLENLELSEKAACACSCYCKNGSKYQNIGNEPSVTACIGDCKAIGLEFYTCSANLEL